MLHHPASWLWLLIHRHPPTGVAPLAPRLRTYSPLPSSCLPGRRGSPPQRSPRSALRVLSLSLCGTSSPRRAASWRRAGGSTSSPSTTAGMALASRCDRACARLCSPPASSAMQRRWLVRDRVTPVNWVLGADRRVQPLRSAVRTGHFPGVQRHHLCVRADRRW
jgi:hypothetical protein